MASMALSFPCAAAAARLCPATPGSFAVDRTTPGRPWRVLPAAALGCAGWARRGPQQRAVGFEVQEASAEEQEEYDKEKAAEAAEEAARRAADPQGPDEMALARLRIWAKSQRSPALFRAGTHKVNPGIAVILGKVPSSK
eukprot:s1908_g1.t1